jgi:hypothetical protein
MSDTHWSIGPKLVTKSAQIASEEVFNSACQPVDNVGFSVAGRLDKGDDDYGELAVDSGDQAGSDARHAARLAERFYNRVAAVSMQRDSDLT